MKNTILSLYDGAKKTLKDGVEKDTKKGIQDEANLTHKEHKKALKGAYKIFVVAGLSKGDIYSFVYQVKLYVKALSESRLTGMQSTMVITKLWVRWKKPGK